VTTFSQMLLQSNVDIPLMLSDHRGVSIEQSLDRRKSYSCYTSCITSCYTCCYTCWDA
jgi:hypothetical protein